MNKLRRAPLPHMTADDFLAWPGDGSGRTFQLIDGEVSPVSPASDVHATIQARVAALLWQAIDAAALSLCVSTEAAVTPALNASANVRIPDIVIAAEPAARGQQIVPDPVVMIEVLSPGNSDDTRDNVRAYATMASVKEILVLHSTRVLAEHHRRGLDGHWAADPDLIGPGETLRVDSVALACPIERAYRGTWLAGA